MPYYTNYSRFENNYESHSSCKKVKAMKEYKCEITGKSIHKGEEYYSLRCWNPYKGKHFNFKFCLNVPTKIRNFYRTYPEEAKEYLSLQAPVLGFFAQHPRRDFDEIEAIMDKLMEEERARIVNRNIHWEF